MDIEEFTKLEEKVKNLVEVLLTSTIPGIY